MEGARHRSNLKSWSDRARHAPPLAISANMGQPRPPKLRVATPVGFAVRERRGSRVFLGELDAGAAPWVAATVAERTMGNLGGDAMARRFEVADGLSRHFWECD